MEFLNDLRIYNFLQFALVAAVLTSIPSGVIGSIIVVRRSTYIAGAVSHSVLGGMGAARYFSVVYNIEWLTPLLGAFIASVFAGLLISWASYSDKSRLDSVLSIIWALGMAVGITFIVKTPGYSQDLMGYLFGNILMVSIYDIVLMVILDMIIVVLVLIFYNPILSICFNEEAAMLRGVPVKAYTTLLMVITAVSTVMLVQVVGVVLVIALLTIPAATISRFAKRLSTIMIGSFLLCLLVSVSGIALSYKPELPVGATIIEISALVYLLSLIIRKD